MTGTGPPSAELQQQFEAAVASFGAEATELALANVHLFRHLRARSRKALKKAAALWQDGVDSDLMFALAPRLSKAGERIEVRVRQEPPELLR